MDIVVKGIVKHASLLVVGVANTELVEHARFVHDTYPTATAAFGRLISGATLLASMLKENQRVILQVAGDGPLKGMVAEADWLLRVRGYVKRPHVHLPLRDEKLDVGKAVGRGYLNVIKDLGLREPYRGSVPLQSGEIAEDLAYYLMTSEQINSAVALGVFVDTDNSVSASGGFMIQTLPGVEEETIEDLEKRLSAIRPLTTLMHEGVGILEIMEEAVGMPVEVLESRETAWFCPCSKERVTDAVAALGRKELREMTRQKGDFSIRCEFCKKQYIISPEDVRSLLLDAGSSPDS